MRSTNLAHIVLGFLLALLSTSVHAGIETLPTHFAEKTEYDTNGSFQTNLFTGSATFTYGFDVPPGTRGLEPTVELTYSSSAGNSWLGLGWSFNLPFIERDVEYTPDNTSDDTFDLQLARSRTELVYDSLEDRYHTEREAFYRIRRDSIGPAGDSWEVTTPSGDVLLFGTDSDSTIPITTPNGTSYVYRWYLVQMTDPYGNTVTYDYQPVGNEFFLEAITYNTDGLRRVEFGLEPTDRPDANRPTYRPGNALSIDRRLASVATYYNGSLVRRYNLNYTVSDGSGRSLLSSVAVVGDDDTSTLPPTSFDYHPAAETLGEFTTKRSSYIIPNGFNERAAGTFVSGGDFNGDGFTDILLYRTQGNAHDWEVALSSKTDIADFVVWRDNLPIKNTATDRAGGNFTMVANFDRDGRSDVLYYDRTLNGGTVWVMRSEGYQFGEFEIWNEGFAIANSDIDRNNGSSLQVGDFNGDGLADLFLYNGLTGDWRVAINSGGSFKPFATWANAPLAVSPADRDLGNQLLAGDFNGDGLTDFCTYRADTTNDWYVSYSTGAGFTPQALWAGNRPILVSETSNQQYGNFVTTGEFNADGMVDILYYNGLTQRWQVMYSTGSSFGPLVEWRNDLFIDNTPSSLQEGSFLLGGDFSAVGRTEFLVYRHRPGAYDWRVISPEGREVDLLKAVNSELGGRIEVTYTPSNEFDNTGDDGLPGLPFSREVVTRVTEDNGMPGDHHAVITTDYHYEGGAYDFERRELIGFSKVRVTDAEGHYTETSFHQDFPRRGRQYLVETFDSAGKLFTRKRTKWDYAALIQGAGSRPITFAFDSRTEDWVYNGNATCLVMINEAPDVYIEGNTYEYGLPVWTQSYGFRTALRREEFNYEHDTTNWILGKVIHSALKDEAGLTVSQRWAEYNAEGDPTRQVQWLTGGRENVANPNTRYQYDSYGNVTLKISPLLYETSTTYDVATNTFPELVENELGHQFTSTYEPGTGQVLTEIDQNLNTMSSTYDVFHRLLTVTDAEGGQTTYTYQRDGAAPEVNGTFQLERYGALDTMDSYSYLDGFGRPVQTKKEGAGGQWITSDLYYDSRGLTSEFSNPYYTSSYTYSAPDRMQPLTTALYDALARATNVIFPDDTSLSVSHDDWQKTYTDALGRMTESFQDGRGNLVQVQEHNAGEMYQTQYRYDLLDNLVSITDAHQNTWEITYDPMSRRTAMDDPDMGYWQYIHDVEGNLVRQVDAKLQEITLGYDRLNRLTTKTYDGYEYVRREYDTAPNNGIGYLSREDFANRDSDLGWQDTGYMTRDYDKMGRTVWETKFIDGGGTATTGYEYDALSRVAAMVYPDGERLDYTYDEQGQLTRMASAEQEYLRTAEYNANNQLTRLVYGNDVETTRAYDPQMLRLTSLYTQNAMGTLLQDFRYFFDDVGNLMEIEDNVNTASATYWYDDLSRLTKAVGVDWSQQYAYNAIGNMVTFIDQNGVRHDRAYGVNAGPHALTGEKGPIPEAKIGARTEESVLTSGQSLIDFGLAVLGDAPPQKIVTVFNSGLADLELGSVTVASGFTVVDPLQEALGPGEADELILQMETTTTGAKAGSISFSTNDPAYPEFSLQIAGVVNDSPTLTWGDVSCVGGALNGSVGTNDAVAILQYAAYYSNVFSCFEPPYTERAFPPAGDVDGDGILGTNDAVLILRHIAFLIDCFPVQPGCDNSHRVDGGGDHNSEPISLFLEVAPTDDPTRFRIRIVASERSSIGGSVLSLSFDPGSITLIQGTYVTSQGMLVANPEMAGQLVLASAHATELPAGRGELLSFEVEVIGVSTAIQFVEDKSFVNDGKMDVSYFGLNSIGNDASVSDWILY